MIFWHKYTEVLIDLGFRTLSGEIQSVGYQKKANKGDISMKRLL
jgi:hypothetical protein